MQYRKHNVSKHAKDRMIIEEQKQLIEKWMREIVWQYEYRQLECRFPEPETRSEIGNGCYWKRQLVADY